MSTAANVINLASRKRLTGIDGARQLWKENVEALPNIGDPEERAQCEQRINGFAAAVADWRMSAPDAPDLHDDAAWNKRAAEGARNGFDEAEYIRETKCRIRARPASLPARAEWNRAAHTRDRSPRTRIRTCRQRCT
jgi:hypothetical protein